MSPDKNPVRLIVSSSNGVCAYAYIKSMVDSYFMLALANSGLKVQWAKIQVLG